MFTPRRLTVELGARAGFSSCGCPHHAGRRAARGPGRQQRGSCQFGRRCFVPSATKVDGITTAVPSQYSVNSPQKAFRHSSHICALRTGFAGDTSAPGSPHVTSAPRCRFRHAGWGGIRGQQPPVCLFPHPVHSTPFPRVRGATPPHGSLQRWCRSGCAPSARTWNWVARVAWRPGRGLGSP